MNKEEATDMVFSLIQRNRKRLCGKRRFSHDYSETSLDQRTSEAVWPVWVWMPDEMREELQDKVQSETNPNGERPSNTKFQSGTMYTTLISCKIHYVRVRMK